MKKGTSIFLSIAGGVAVVFGVFGCLYGFNKNVHNWVDGFAHKDNNTSSVSTSQATGAFSLTVTPAAFSAERAAKEDTFAPTFVVKVLKYGVEATDKNFDYDIDTSKAVNDGAYTMRFDSDHIVENTDAANQVNGYSYKSGATLTFTLAAASMDKWSGSYTVHFYQVGQPNVKQDLKISLTLKTAAASSSVSA